MKFLSDSYRLWQGKIHCLLKITLASSDEMTIENAIIRSKEEVALTMTTNIVETLPWIDYREVFAKFEERGRATGRAEGKAEGKAERDMEIALKAFGQLHRGVSLSAIVDALKEYGIPDGVIESARKQAGS